MLGRSIYAIGGSELASVRLGLPVVKVKFFVYVLIGLIAGITGIVHSSQARVANPFDLVGSELNVLAAVVLGGTRITGGRGSVFGTLVGVFLVTMINNSLVLLGVPSYWERCVIGLLVLIGAGVPILVQRVQHNRNRAALVPKQTGRPSVCGLLLAARADSRTIKPLFRSVPPRSCLAFFRRVRKWRKMARTGNPVMPITRYLQSCNTSICSKASTQISPLHAASLCPGPQ